jgi:CBS-domain-containing membrane protein
MTVIRKNEPRGPAIMLHARTAEELMTPNPVAIAETMGVQDAVAFLLNKRITGAPVIDVAGRPVGVITQTDILHHDRCKAERLDPPEFEAGYPMPPKRWDEFQIEKVDRTMVRDLMTPVVFTVALDTHPRKVISEMCAMGVHRLFVVDKGGVLVGVISALDILRDLNRED